MSKSIRVFALFALCLSLAAFAPIYAGQGTEAPAFSFSTGAPSVRSITDQNMDNLILDASKMPVRLDGRILPEGLEADQARHELYLAIDEKEGVINAFRTYEEFDTHVKANFSSDCASQTEANQVCVFFNVPNCTLINPTDRAVAVNCGFLVGGITGPALLNGPIQSFILGCNTTFLFPNANCTVPPNGVGVTGVPGTCINVTNSPFNCAGCGPRKPV